ncbi:hypothetical protein D3C71_981720 [compost metagenome]
MGATGQLGAKRFQWGRLQDVRKDTEIRRAARDIQLGRQRHRFARIADLCLKEVIRAPIDFVGDAVEHVGPVRDRCRAPAAYRLMARRDGLVDHGLGGLVHVCKADARCRVDAGEALFAIDEPAIDEVSVLLQHDCSLARSGPLGKPC